MKYGILGDIHGNLSALEAVIARLDEAGADQLISVGDVVGYGAAPSECIALLQRRGATVVMGNHDAACVGALDDSQFNPYARAAVAWTREALSPEEHAWLESLPYTATLEHCQVAHGTLAQPELFDYVLSVTDAEPSLDIMSRQVCFVGHSHVPITVMRLAEGGETAYTYDDEIDLQGVAHALVNVGSVGQPRDENPLTAYALYDSDARRVWIRRTEYDIDLEAQRIRDAGLPEVLAERLRLGL